MPQAATFIFHGTLQDFLRPAVRQQLITYVFNGAPAVKDAIEALGVPHPEVAFILRKNRHLQFTDRLYAGDEIHVHPVTTVPQTPAQNSLIPPLPEPVRFILDVHLGTLAKALRMLGFDTLYEKNLNDNQIARIAEEESRIVLTRDIGLLKHRIIAHGYWLRSQHTTSQLQEVIKRYGLSGMFSPFKRCLACNTIISSVPKENILHRIPANTRLYFDEFFYCTACDRVYWKGSHYEHMVSAIKALQSI